MAPSVSLASTVYLMVSQAAIVAAAGGSVAVGSGEGVGVGWGMLNR